MITPVLLDTATLSALMGSNLETIAHFNTYAEVHDQFAISAISRYEIRRGLKIIGATAQMRLFESICSAHQVLPLGDDVLERGADIYADLYRHGLLIGDADILIAATALEYNLTLVTNKST